MQENKRLNQIDLSILGVIVVIFILFHSIYLLTSEKKKILNIETISDEEMIVQALINRLIAFLVVVMFFTFAVTNYNELLKTSNDEETINIQFTRVIISLLALLSVGLDVYLAFKEYISINENKNSNN